MGETIGSTHKKALLSNIIFTRNKKVTKYLLLAILFYHYYCIVLNYASIIVQKRLTHHVHFSMEDLIFSKEIIVCTVFT